MRARHAWAPAALLAAALSLAPASAEDGAMHPLLHTNQGYVEGLSATPEIDMDDTQAVFRFVFSSLADEVTVYPTENYYYFSFFQRGVEIAGNIRLDALDRDKGIVHFAYFTSYSRWNSDLVSRYAPLNADAGVTVARVEPLVYDVTFEGRSVRFRLNDLRDVRPDPAILADGEEYVGPVYDESGLSFFFLYSRPLKLFHFVLNRDVSAPELYVPADAEPRILIGQRTGFAFVADRFRPRHILIGVYEDNSLVNNYLDGPFDQLPDNFIEGDRFREILEDAFPAVAGRLDRFGNSDGGASRLLITPYVYYASLDDLTAVLACADGAGEDEAAYYRCFASGQPDYNGLDTTSGD